VNTGLDMGIRTLQETDPRDKESSPARSAVAISVCFSLCRSQPLFPLFCGTSCLLHYARNARMLAIRPDDATPPYKPKTTGLRLKITSLIAMSHLTSFGKEKRRKSRKTTPGNPGKALSLHANQSREKSVEYSTSTKTRHFVF